MKAGGAKAVEFRRTREDDASGAQVEGWSGRWVPFPVEYKRGKPKRDRSDEVQLCAQALCLEEMLEVSIPGGALFYGKTRRRFEVAFDAALRAETERAANRLHELIRSGITPKAYREPKCEHCSLLHLCLPEAMSSGRSAARYLARSLRGLEASP